MVCRQLGFGYANDAIQTDFFGGNASSMVLSGVQCHGNEEFLSYCLHDKIGQISCPGKRENIAGVVCTSGKQGWREVTLHSLLTLAQDGSEWLTSYSGFLSLKNESPIPH